MSNVTIDDIRRSINQSDNDASGFKNALRKLRTMRNELVRILGDKIEQFGRIDTFDEDYRLAVMRGEIPHDPSHDQNVCSLYQLWLNSCQQYLEDVELLQKSGLRLRKSKLFFSCVNEARGILTDDTEFFSRINLDDLRDQAIDDFRSGRCEPA